MPTKSHSGNLALPSATRYIEDHPKDESTLTHSESIL